MKIVQSLWSKPGWTNASKNSTNFNSCGWLDRKYHYYSWVLSSHQLKNFYNEVELVTDRAGQQLLIEKLKLPYTAVKVVLDALDDYHKDLWALGKIYAYSIQETPFIHVNGDVYIWSRFRSDLEKSSLVCQNKEEGENYGKWYNKIFIHLTQHLSYFPKELERSLTRNDSIKSINAGILGGTKLSFFKEYCQKAFEFVDNNKKELALINMGEFNTIFEQFLFCAMAEERNEQVQYYHLTSDYPTYAFDFTGVPTKTTYLHMYGGFKKHKLLVDWLEFKVMMDYAEQYKLIQKLLRSGEI